MKASITLFIFALIPTAFSNEEILSLPQGAAIAVSSITKAITRKGVTVVETNCSDGPSSCLYLIGPSGEEGNAAFLIKKAGASVEECSNRLTLNVVEEKISLTYKNCEGKIRTQNYRYELAPARLFKL